MFCITYGLTFTAKHRFYDRSWSFHVDLDLKGTDRAERLSRDRAIQKFRNRCTLVPGLGDFYTETHTWDKYMVKPRIEGITASSPDKGEVGR